MTEIFIENSELSVYYQSYYLYTDVYNVLKFFFSSNMYSYLRLLLAATLFGTENWPMTFETLSLLLTIPNSATE